ncbi:MAG TPA: glycosyltransferase family 4 protein [Pseudolysinimonas sp.]|nr:glycosyltransferase family 4 protein [Pseudolysinimonas sp.]
MTNVLVVTSDPIGPKMAGPAIRSWNIALVLSAEHAVRLVTTSILDAQTAPFEQFLVPPGRHRAFAKLERWADVIIFQGHAMSMFRPLRRSRKILVADIYDPMHVEQLEQARDKPFAEYKRIVADRVELLNEQLLRADFLMAASDRQRLFYLGQLAALGRLNPHTYGDEPDLKRLLRIVPFGLPTDDPVHHARVLKGVHPGIGADDKVIIWGGGLYSWFDPLTLIRAVAQLHRTRPSVRLFFQGTKHPGVDEMPIVEQSRELARSLGVLDTAVFFNETWVPYEDRQNYLMDADVGVSTHGFHLETTLAFRTRILDYLWTSLPMVATKGDSFGELIRREQLGVAVPPEDIDALADALELVLFDDDFAARARENVQRVRERFRWETVLQPLVDYVREPWHAPDRRMIERESVVQLRLVKHYGVLHDLRRVVHYLREGGIAGVSRKIRDRLTTRPRRVDVGQPAGTTGLTGPIKRIDR